MVSHPEVDLHNIVVQNIQSLFQNIQHSNAEIEDNLYNFFLQYINVSMGSFPEIFKTMVKQIIYNNYHHMTPRQAAAYIIKQHIEWPDKFLTQRIYLADIRNQVVFGLWLNFQHVIPAQWMPEAFGTPKQNSDYHKAAYPLGSRMLDPKDSERIDQMLQWFHYLKLIHYIKHNTIDYDNLILNTCYGYWLHMYNTHGMTKLMWELFLDVWHYDQYFER